MQKIILFLISTFFVIQSFGQTRDELERKRKEIQQEIAELQKNQSSLQKDKKASLRQLSIIQSKIKKRYAVINNINAQVRLIDNNIFSNNREIYRLRKQIDTLKEQYARTVVYAYENRSNYDMINFLFSSVNFNDAIRRIQYLNSYRGYRQEQVENIKKTQELLKQKINTLIANKEAKSQVLEEQTQQMKNLEEEKNEQSSYVAKLKQREKELQKELSAKRNLDRNIQSAINAIVRREIENARREALAEEKRRKEENANAAKGANALATPKNTIAASGGTSSGNPAAPPARNYNPLESTPEVTKVSLSFENNKNNLPWPVEKGTITSPFGKRKIEGTSLIEDNIGVTIATITGSNVKAVFEGIVSSIYDIGGSQTITLKHGKYFTTYYNLSGINVTKGQKVNMGQVIGKAGENEDGEGEILFVVNMESRFMDPEQWLKSK